MSFEKSKHIVHVAKRLGQNIVSVKPMSSPSGNIFYMDYFYEWSGFRVINFVDRWNVIKVQSYNIESIRDNLEYYNIDIDKCTINLDGTVDVNDDVDISDFLDDSYLKIRFGKTKNFTCPRNLKHHLGCPRYVDGKFTDSHRVILFRDEYPDVITEGVNLKSKYIDSDRTDIEKFKGEYMYALAESPNPKKSMVWLQDYDKEIHTMLVNHFNTLAAEHSEIFQFGLECDLFSEDVVNVATATLSGNHKLG